MLIRVFRAEIHEGQQDAFERFFRETAIPELHEQPGLISVTVGLPHEQTPHQFLMTTIWRDLDALKGFTGENWQEAVIHPDEANLVREVEVRHYYQLDP